MATLRDLVPGLDQSLAGLVPGSGPSPVQQGLRGPATAQIEDQAVAAGMGQLRRGFTTGRLQGDANALAADESAARAAGDVAAADALRLRIGGLQQRAGTFAPAEQDVTQLGLNPGRILDWGLGTMGQGAASMMEPLATGIGANAAAGVLGLVPHPLAKVGAAGLRGAGVLGGGYLNYRQNKGEFYNDAVQDPALMAGKTAQEINQAGTVHGLAAGALDTALPAWVASRIVPGGTKVLSGLSGGAKAAVGLVGEGATETLQGESKRGILGHLNPQRDTSGDSTERWNDFAGGVIGAGPIVGLSHLGDVATARLGVKDDTSSDDVSGGKTMPGAPKREKLTDSLKRGAAKYDDAEFDASEEWNTLLQGFHNPDQEVATTEQHAALLKELGGRAAKGDTVAQQHIDALNKLDPADNATWFNAPERDAAYEHILGDGTDHEKVIEAYKGRKLNAQGGSDKATVRLAADILSSSLPEDADPALHSAAKDVARSLAGFAAQAEKRGTARDPLTVMDAAQQLVGLYGNKRAAAIAAQAATALGVETSPLFKQLQKNIAGAGDIRTWKTSQRAARAAVGDQMVAVIPATKQLELRKDGVDFTSPAYKAALVDYVEQLGKAISYGATDAKGEPVAVPPSAYAKLTAKVGAEAARAMLDMVAPGKIIEKESDAPKENGGGTTGPAKESDRSSGLGDDPEMDDFDIDAAKKSMERAPGAKLYLTKGKRGIATAGDTEGAHPFVRDKKTGNLPKLSLADDTDTKSGFNTLEAMEERAFEMMGGDLFARINSTTWRPTAEKDRRGLYHHRQVREDMGVNDIKNDDPKAQPVLGIGSFRIRRISAKDVMDDRGVAAGRRTTLLRQYLDQDGVLDEDDRTLTQLATLSRKVRELTDAAQPQTVKGNPQAVPVAGQGAAELEELKAQRVEVIAKLAKKLGVEAKDDATVEDLANAYFSQRFLITAEQMAEKDQLRLNQAEVLAMIRKGNQYINKSTDPGLGATPAAVQADMNLIRFRSKSAITKSDEKRGIAVIPASELVAWVFANRNDYNPTEGAKESALEFRNALMEGIGALAEGGYMDALPFMINAEGDIERFGSKKHGGFPPSLKLGGMRQADLNEARKQYVEASAAQNKKERADWESAPAGKKAWKRRRQEEARQARVARDQSKEEPVKNTDPDELLAEGREGVRHAPNAPTDGQRTIPGMDPGLSDKELAKSGERFWDAPSGESAEDREYRLRVQKIDAEENPELDPFTGERKDKPKRQAYVANEGTRKSEKVDTRRSGRSMVLPETAERPRDDAARTGLEPWEQQDEDERTQLDWDLREQNGGVPTDFTAAQMAKAVADAALTEGETKPMTPANATARAPALAREVLWQLDSFDGLHDGKKVKSDVPADPQGAFQRVQRLVAALSRPASTTGSRLAGGKHYAAPLALILTPANVKVLISKAQNKAAAGPRLERMRDKVALALLTAGDNELSLAGRVVAARALLGNDALTSVTMKAPLKVMADREEKRQADAMADQHFKDEAQKAKIAAVQQKRSAKPMEAKTEPASTISNITVVEHKSSGYAPRTKHNADSAGLTVAIASDFSTAGEKLTARVAGDKYLGIPLDVEPAKAGVRLAKAMRALGTTTLNVAGNGIYTLAKKGMTQAQVNQHVYDTIAAAHALVPITKIVTGGQTGVDIAGAVAAHKLDIPVTVTMPGGLRQRNAEGVDFNNTAGDVAAQIMNGAAALKVAQTEAPAPKLNAMRGPARALDPTLAAVAKTRSLMTMLGFKTAPPQFVSLAGKLLTDPRVDVGQFIKDSAEALSHALMEGASGEAIRNAIDSSPAWLKERQKLVSRAFASGVGGKVARSESYRKLAERIVAGELAPSTPRERSITRTLAEAAKALVDALKKMFGTPEFTDVVREQLNALFEQAGKPATVQAGYKKVNFQEAVDADPGAAQVLAFMAKNPNTALSGSIVLAHSGSIYRNAKNMLHDLDFGWRGTKEEADAYLKSKYDGALQVADFYAKDTGTTVTTYIVPPVGATITDVTRQFGDKGKLTGYSVMKDGKVIGRKWADKQGEQREGEAGTIIDFFTGPNEPVPTTTIPFTVDGVQHTVKALPASSIFDKKLSMGRDKDLNDFVLFTPSEGSKLNAETATKVSSDAEVAEAIAYLKKTRGPEIMVEVSKEFPNAGEYLEAERLIKLSTAIGPGILSVAYHEGLHDAWATVLKNHPGAREALTKVLADGPIYERLKAMLANEPAALASMAADPEERVAYAYQFCAAGELEVDKPATTLFAKFRKMLRKVLGMVRESETALDIMTALHDGKLAEPSAAGRVLGEIMARETWNADVKRKFDAVVQNTFAAIAPSNDVLRREDLSGTARLLGRILFSNPGEETAGDGQGYLNARKQKISQYTNYLHAALKGLSERDLADVAKQLQLKTPLESIAYAPVRDAVKGVRALTKRYYEYATAKSPHGEPVLRLEYLGDDHYPRVWDLVKLVGEGGRDKFIAMLMQPKYAKAMGAALTMANAGRTNQVTMQQVAEMMYERLVEKNGVDDKAAESDRADDDLLDPFFASQKERSFKWLDDADVEPFLEKDVVGAMSRYLHQGIRAVEFSRRFGEHGKFLRPLLIMKGDPALNPETGKVEPSPTHGRIASEMYESLKKAGTKGAEADAIVARHMDDVRKAVAAHEGSLGHTISPTWRKFSSAAMAYQNLRLLPLSLFAAFGDTIGIAARYGDGGGKMAFQAFTQGLRDVYARWKDAASDMPAERTKTMWENIAEMVGAVDSHMFLEQMGKAHTSEFTTDWARKANRALFMANGLTAWDRSMRVSATKAAVLFLQHHATEPDKTHSTRWLKELGLKASDIPLDADGNLIYDRHVLAAEKKLSLEEATKRAEKIHFAITRWVEGAVLTPTAGQRPTWASDPHFAVLFHLKQFTYSFHHTILKRAYTEAGHGNMSPLGALMAAVPTMVAADLVKGVLLGGGSLPAYMQPWDLGDHLMQGASRAGLGGIGQFGIDGLRDPLGVMGPTVEQIATTVLNPGDIAQNALNGIPLLRSIGGLKDAARAV